MTNKSKGILIYENGLLYLEKDLSKATGAQNELVLDYNSFIITDILAFYYLLQYCQLEKAAMDTKIGASFILKIKDLRSLVANANKSETIKQFKQITDGAKKGEALLLDALS